MLNSYCKMSNTQRDLQLLVDTLQNKQEAEADGVKFIYMDDSTIYRFENNRMKKVSAALIKKANKYIQNEALDPEANENITTAKQAAKLKPTRTTTRSRAKQQPNNVSEDDVSDNVSDNEAEAEVIPQIVKPKRTTTRKASKVVNAAQDIDLNEYWNTKTRNDYLQQELERLNNKVSKLKHYKNIVNRLTGAEYDVDMQYPQQQQSQQQSAAANVMSQQQSQPYVQQYDAKPKRNDNLFLFN